MKAREVIEGSTFDPDDIKIMGQAFDEAWNSIAGNVGDDPLAIETVRLKLANAILASAKSGIRDMQQLKNAALQRIALQYRGRSHSQTSANDD